MTQLLNTWYTCCGQFRLLCLGKVTAAPRTGLLCDAPVFAGWKGMGNMQAFCIYANQANLPYLTFFDFQQPWDLLQLFCLVNVWIMFCYFVLLMYELRCFCYFELVNIQIMFFLLLHLVNVWTMSFLLLLYELCRCCLSSSASEFEGMWHELALLFEDFLFTKQ